MLFSSDDLAKLSAPHVCRQFFADVEFADPIGRRRLHTGTGPITIGGQTWYGTSDPFGGQLVGLAGVQEARFGQAPAITAVFSGASLTWFKAIWDEDIEGTACTIYFAVFDQETGEVLIDLKRVFDGRLSSPAFEMVGLGIRAATIKVISKDEGIQYPATRYDWSPAGQRSRYPADEGLDLIGSDLIEYYKPK